MQTAYENGSIPWDSYSDGEEAVFEGRGYYISKIPITKYNNNLNMLLDEFWLFIFNEDMSVQGSVCIEGLNGKRLNIEMFTQNYASDYNIPKSMPYMRYSYDKIMDNLIWVEYKN